MRIFESKPKSSSRFLGHVIEERPAETDVRSSSDPPEEAVCNNEIPTFNHPLFTSLLQRVLSGEVPNAVLIGSDGEKTYVRWTGTYHTALGLSIHAEKILSNGL